MAVRDLFRNEPANRVQVGFGLSPGSTWALSGERLTVQIAMEEPRTRIGRALAERFTDVVRHDQRVKSVSLHQSGGETLVTVIAERLDEELEFRLHDNFEALASGQGDSSVGELFIYDEAAEVPGGGPKGEELLSAATDPAGTPHPS